MKKESFERLVEKIQVKIGDERFRPEGYRPCKRARTENATSFFGGQLCGEYKLAICIRILAGASYLDVFLAFAVGITIIYASFHEVVGWLNETFDFPLLSWIKDENIDELKKVSEGFARFTNGGLWGIIGAIDGIAIRIRCPSSSRDGVKDPRCFFCRKQFFALNVQAIVDSYKRFIWVSTGHNGSAHDSTAFACTELYELLKSKAAWLLQNGLFIVADSAYNLASWLINPYPNVTIVQDAKDNFNFWLSNSRIRVECAFGELIMRWGIFWRTILFDLDRVGPIIMAAMHLHNFLINERLAEAEKDGEEEFVASFSSEFMMDESDHTQVELPVALVTNNDAPNPGGRPTVSDAHSRDLGLTLRNSLASKLARVGLHRPLRNMKRNKYGHVYVSS
jgi:hypothetical protein